MTTVAALKRLVSRSQGRKCVGYESLSIRRPTTVFGGTLSSCYSDSTVSSEKIRRSNFRSICPSPIQFFHSSSDNISNSKRHFHATVSIGDDDYPLHTVLPFPALSPTMEMGTISKWEVSEGEEFSAGSILCSIETDKATMDFEAQDDGIIAKILKDGSDATDLPIGTPIAIVVEDAEDVAAFADYVAVEKESDGATESAVAAADSPAPDKSSPTATPVVGGQAGTSLLFPSARFLAESKGLDATGLTGTGKGGRVTKGDVLEAINNGTPMPALVVKEETGPELAATSAASTTTASAVPLEDLPLPEIETYGSYEDVPNNNMRKVVAKRLTASKQEVPCTYTSMEVELDNVLKLRKKLVTEHDIKVSVNDIVVRCSALALRDVPEVNGSYDPKTDTVKLSDSVDISIAVAIPNGLITPIVENTDKLGLSEISDKVRELAGRAREGKLAPEEYSGGTFCISNLGMFGIDEFTAIVNPPQAAILAVGGGVKRIVPTPYIDSAEEQPKPSIKTIMTARLSSDRRVVDEATASLFLSAFKNYINKPELLLL